MHIPIKENAMTLNLFKYAAPALMLALVAGAVGCQHERPAPTVSRAPASLSTARNTPMAELDGYAWQASGPQSKLDFLLGVECALAMEAALKQVADERGGTVELSRFAHGWQIAFRDKARPDIVRQIDEFYVRQPDERGRHVFDVIWTEMIRPATASQ